MPRRSKSDLLTQLARIGAKQRIEEIQEEIKSLNAILGKSGTPKAGTTKAVRPKRRRRRMSAARRKAVSVRMKKYWAKRRAAAKKKH